MKLAKAVVPRNLWIQVKHEADKLFPEPKEVVLSSAVKDEAEWFSEDAQSYMVVFPKSPFTACRFVVPAGGSVCSGPPTPEALRQVRQQKKEVAYDYQVEPVPGDFHVEPVAPKAAQPMTLLKSGGQPVQPCGTIIIHP